LFAGVTAARRASSEMKPPCGRIVQRDALAIQNPVAPVRAISLVTRRAISFTQMPAIRSVITTFRGLSEKPKSWHRRDDDVETVVGGPPYAPDR